MTEALFSAVLIAVALNWIAGTAGRPDGFIRRTSRGAFMRDLNVKMEAKPSRSGADRSNPNDT